MMISCEIQKLVVVTLDRQISNSRGFVRDFVPRKIPDCNGTYKVVPVHAAKVRRKRGRFYLVILDLVSFTLEKEPR